LSVTRKQKRGAATELLMVGGCVPSPWCGSRAAAISFAVAPAADAKGCIKGAIAGHMAGHGKLGAAAGCAVGHHEANKADANKKNPKANAQAPAGQK
jgi:hypothetical protein